MRNVLLLVGGLILGHIALAGPSPDFAQVRTNLYIVGADKSTTLMDGTLTQYDNDYSNEIDGMDARKMTNPSENWGMLRGSTVLIIERRRTIGDKDSIFFKMWNMRNFTYRVEFIVSNLNRFGRVGILEDKYLNTRTSLDLNGSSFVDFTVTADPASRASDRFQVIFSTPSFSVMPLSFTAAKAVQQGNAVQINWSTANESNVKHFDVERSADGARFLKIADTKANNSFANAYQIADDHPLDGASFYRIRSEDFDGIRWIRG